MANIGPTTAFYKVETSLSRANNAVDSSRVRIAAGKQNAYAGDRVSNSAIADAFRLDFAGTKAGIKGATVVMGYLETGMRVLDSASNILSRLQEVAVLGANNTNTITEHEMLNAEAEGLAQEFNRLMQGATYKGKDIFVDTAGSEFLSMGSRNAELTFGLGKVDYSELFGEARSVGAGLPNAGQLVNLTKLPSDAVLGKSINFETTVGDGFLEINVDSNLPVQDVLNLQDTGGVSIDSDGVVSYTFDHPVYDITTVEIGEIDPVKNGTDGTLKINFYDDATIPGTSTFVNGDFSSTMSEVLSYTEFFKTADVERTRDGFISELDDENGNAITMGAIADADRTYKNVTLSYQTGQAGTAGTGTVRAHIQTADAGGVETITNIEIIDGGEGFKANEILVIPEGDQYSQFHGDIAGQELTITNVSDGYIHTVSQPSTTTAYGNQMWGPGETGQYDFDATGAPAENGNNLTYGAGDIKQNQVVNTIIDNLTWGDGESGQYDFDATGAPAENGNNLTYGPGDIKQEQVVGSVIGNLTWDDGETGQYDFDATGAPAENGNNLTYGPGDIKQEQVVNTIQVNDTWGDGESGQYDFDATGAPAVNGNNLTYGPGDIKQEQVVSSIIDNLTWGPGESGQYDFDATGAPAVEGNNLTYGPGDIKQEQVVTTTIVGDSPVNEYSLRNVTGPVDVYSLQNVTVPQDVYSLRNETGPVNVYSLRNETGPVNVYSLRNETGPVDVYSLENVTVPQDVYSLANVTGPVNVYSLRNVTGPENVYSLANVTVPQNVYSLANVFGAIGTNYLGESIPTEVVTDYFQPNTKTVPTNWTSYNDRIDFGSNFTISEFANQNNDIVDPLNGIIDTDPRIEYSIPTPTEAQMVLPPYTTIFGRVASDTVKGNDDTAVVSRENDMDVSVTGGALKLDTGKFNFSEGFGILHGPAAVSEVFSADEGDFLKLDYTAQGVNDDYHVAGYIYEVNDDGSAKTDPIMALNETGTSTNGRASVRVPETGNYRFVFVVGTHDLTGGRLAGADMTIDNIVSEKGFLLDETAIASLIKAVTYNNSGSVTGETKTVTSKLLNDESSFVSDEVISILEGFNTDDILPTLNIINSDNEDTNEQEVKEFEEVNASVLTSKIESVQQLLNNARVRAGSQYSALESAIISATDLRTQYEMGYNMVHDLNFTEETAHLAKKQILQQASNAMLAQANNGQRGLLQMLEQ